MLRLVDAPAAIAARGDPPAVELSVLLDIADPALPGNAGRWTLQVSAGAGTLTRADHVHEGNGFGRGARPSLRLGPRGLAAMFAGVPLATLRLAGLADGDPAADASLAPAVGRPAYMIHSFQFPPA